MLKQYSRVGIAAIFFILGCAATLLLLLLLLDDVQLGAAARFQGAALVSAASDATVSAPASAAVSASASVATGRNYSHGTVELALENRCLRAGGRDRLTTRTYAAVIGVYDETAEDMAWTAALRVQGVDVLLYYKRDPSAEFFLPDDAAKEDTPYLAYIVQHYDCLPDYSILLHAKPWAHAALYECLRPTPLRAAQRAWLPLGDDYVERWVDPSLNGTVATWEPFQERLWERLEARGGWQLPQPWRKPLKLYCCPEFILSRAVIRQWPREFWATVLEYVYEVARTHRIARVRAPRPPEEAPEDWLSLPPQGWTGMGMEHTFPMLFDTAFETRERSQQDICQFYKPGCSMQAWSIKTEPMTLETVKPCKDARFDGSLRR